MRVPLAVRRADVAAAVSAAVHVAVKPPEPSLPVRESGTKGLRGELMDALQAAASADHHVFASQQQTSLQPPQAPLHAPSTLSGTETARTSDETDSGLGASSAVPVAAPAELSVPLPFPGATAAAGVTPAPADPPPPPIVLLPVPLQRLDPRPRTALSSADSFSDGQAGVDSPLPLGVSVQPSYMPIDLTLKPLPPDDSALLPSATNITRGVAAAVNDEGSSCIMPTGQQGGFVAAAVRRTLADFDDEPDPAAVLVSSSAVGAAGARALMPASHILQAAASARQAPPLGYGAVLGDFEGMVLPAPPHLTVDSAEQAAYH